MKTISNNTNQTLSTFFFLEKLVAFWVDLILILLSLLILPLGRDTEGFKLFYLLSLVNLFRGL